MTREEKLAMTARAQKTPEDLKKAIEDLKRAMLGEKAKKKHARRSE